MPFEMLDVGPPLTEVKVDRLELQLGHALPRSYKSFLLRFNGGRPDPAFFPIRDFDRSPFGTIHFFFGIDRTIRTSNVDWNVSMYRRRMPRELLPIAGDELGNRICLAVTGSNAGCVYFWDHDNEHSLPMFANLYLIACSFEAFVNSIYLEDISAEVARARGDSGRSWH